MRGSRPGFRVVVIVALASIVSASAVSCSSDGSGDEATATTPEETATTTTEPVTTATDGATLGTASWTMEQELQGELDGVVAWSEGFAGIMDVDGGEIYEGGEIWYSVDGIEWARESEESPGPGGDVFKLVGRQGDLFALSGDWSNDTEDKTLWHRRADEPWEVVVADPRLEFLAVGDERLIAYAQNGFEVVGVFDTSTLEAAEYAGLPDVDFGAADAEFEPGIYQGRALALDDGFLADVSWLMGVNDVRGRLFFSEDGSTWIEHPSPPDGPLVLQFGESSAPVHEGVNLLYAGGVSPGRSWLTDDGLEFESTSVPGNWSVVGTTVGFVTVDPFGAIHRSTDGSTWISLEAPPTWGGRAEPDEHGFVRGTIVDGNDQLLALSVHGEVEGWGGVADPTTEIWSTSIDDVITDSP